MSSLAAGTTLTTSLVATGDTSGELVFKTNGTTTAMSIDASQNVTLVNAPTMAGLTYPSTDGSSGQALVTDGSGTLSFGEAGISKGTAIVFSLVWRK